MHTGFVTHRPDLFDEERRPSPTTTPGEGPYARSSATGSSWPQGHPSERQEALQAIQDVAETVETDGLYVTVTGVRSWEGSLVLLEGHTDDRNVVFGADVRAAAPLIHGIGQHGSTVALVEPWQVYISAPRLRVVETEHPARSELKQLWDAHRAVEAERRNRH